MHLFFLTDPRHIIFAINLKKQHKQLYDTNYYDRFLVLGIT